MDESSKKDDGGCHNKTHKIPIIACQQVVASRITVRFVGSKSMMYPICVQWNTFQLIWWGIAQ